jgi:molybdopterin/thiamine biosynthesis adenylyltransferase
MNTELDRLADRHLRPDPQGVLADAEQGQTGSVLVKVCAGMAPACGIQHLLWMLVNLLSRQFKVVKDIVLDIPDVPLHAGVAPFGAKPGLAETLEECVHMVSGPHVVVRRVGDGPAPEVALTIGVDASVASWHWQLYADGWRYFVGLEGEAPPVPPQSNISIGPYLCASYAAGEVFKLFRGMKPGKGEFIRKHFASAWTMSCTDTWDNLADGPGSTEFNALPHFYFAGTGAVAQAAALCLGSSEFVGACTAVDKDKLDLTNDNRYVLSTRQDDGKSKVIMTCDYLTSRGFACKPVAEWWETFATAGGRHSLNDEVRMLERAYKFPLVLSCVDKNIPRHALQQLLPQLIVGGSTDGLSAKVSIFDLGASTSCLKCHNPIKSRNAIVQERIIALKQLDSEQRTGYACDLGLSPADVEHLLGSGGCGTLSEGDIDRFAAGSPEMSVGFVSAAAGTLLAAQFLRYLYLGADASTRDGAMIVATFSRAKVRAMRVAQDNTCDCAPLLRGRWTAIWHRSYST